MLGFNITRNLRNYALGLNIGPLAKGRSGNIARNAVVLGFGTALSQTLNILSTPVLSWYYSPETFGLMAAALSIVYLAASLANVNYDSAIVLPNDDQEGLDLFYFCLFCNMICSIVFF